MITAEMKNNICDLRYAAAQDHRDMIGRGFLVNFKS